MAEAKKAGQGTPKPPAQPAGKVRWYQASKPNYVKLHEGEIYEGIFIGVTKTNYGPGYKFRGHDGEIFTIGGNRAQIDQVFSELMGNPQGFVGDTIIGHALIVARGPNTLSKAGRKVAQYQIGHDLDRCPKGCKE